MKINEAIRGLIYMEPSDKKKVLKLGKALHKREVIPLESPKPPSLIPKTATTLKLSKPKVLLKAVPKSPTTNESNSTEGNGEKLTWTQKLKRSKLLQKGETTNTSKILLKSTKTKTLLKRGGTSSTQTSKILLKVKDGKDTKKTITLSRKLESVTESGSKILLRHTELGNVSRFKNKTENISLEDSDAKKILIVDDELSILKVLSHIFKKQGYITETANSEPSALVALKKQTFDLVISDIRLGDSRDGLDLLKECKLIQPNTPVVIITGYASVKVAIKALKDGAFDLVTKPFKMDQLTEVVENAINHGAGMSIEKMLSQDMSLHFGTIVGEDPKMQHIYSVIKRIAKTDATVLIQGEKGTGKALFAQIIHYCSRRAEKPFITVSGKLLSQAHISPTLIDQLAIKANGGTLFFNDLHLATKEAQASLLNLLTTKVASPSSSGEKVKVDIRFLASTAKPLKELQKSGQFSKNLYFRMCAFTLDIPSLRERITDIPLVWNYLNMKHAESSGIAEVVITEEALTAIINYPWPGNINEMKNTIESVVHNCINHQVEKKDLPESIRLSKVVAVSDTQASVIGQAARKYLQQQVSSKLHTENTSLRIRQRKD